MADSISDSKVVGKVEGTYLQIIEELEVVGSLSGLLDSLTQGYCASSTLGPVGATHSIKGPGSFGHAADQIQLGLGVGPAGWVNTSESVRDKQGEYSHT